MAGAVPYAIGGLIGGSLLKKIFKKPKAPDQPLSIPTRDDAAAATQQDDEVRRRRGSAADQLLGAAGAEPAGVGIKALTGE